MRRLLGPLIDLFFPPACIFCSEKLMNDPDLLSTCDCCLDGLLDLSRCCPYCGYPLQSGRVCALCQEQEFSFNGVCAINIYKGNLKRVVLDYKYRQKKHLALPLGKLMARQVRRSSWPDFTAVVPVPLHSQRLRERGFDQVQLLAQSIGSELDLPVLRILKRIRPTLSQTGLGFSDRWQNIKGVFQVSSEQSPGGSLLLVDDLLTTGATAHCAAAELLGAGAGSVYVSVIGR